MRSIWAHAVVCSLPILIVLAALRIFVGPERMVATAFLEAHRPGSLATAFIAYFTAWGNYILYGVYVFLLIHARRSVNRDLERFVGCFFIAFVATLLVVYLLKGSVGRARPYLEPAFSPWSWIGDHHSFPSGHTTEAVAAILPLSLLFRSWALTLTLAVYAAGVAFTRIYLGVHYLTDILGGLVMGNAGGLAAWLAYRRQDSDRSSNILSSK